MAQPVEYTRKANFRDIQAVSPADPLPGNKVDDEFNAVKVTTDQVRERLARIQRDDGHLANGIVGIEQIKAELFSGFNPPEEWAEGTEYAVNAGVLVSGALYVSKEAHTASGDFATDFAADKWRFVFDFGADATAAAASAAAAAASESDAADSAIAAAGSATAAAASEAAAEEHKNEVVAVVPVTAIDGGRADSIYTSTDPFDGGGA